MITNIKDYINSLNENNTVKDIEKETVIQLYKDGKSQGEIADELGIDVLVVANYTKHLGFGSFDDDEEDDRIGDDPSSKQYYDRTLENANNSVILDIVNNKIEDYGIGDELSVRLQGNEIHINDINFEAKSEVDEQSLLLSNEDLANDIIDDLKEIGLNYYLANNSKFHFWLNTNESTNEGYDIPFDDSIQIDITPKDKDERDPRPQSDQYSVSYVNGEYQLSGTIKKDVGGNWELETDWFMDEESEEFYDDNYIDVELDIMNKFNSMVKESTNNDGFKCNSCGGWLEEEDIIQVGSEKNPSWKCPMCGETDNFTNDDWSRYESKTNETVEHDETCYIEYLNKEKNFARDKEIFTGPAAYQQAVKWGRENLDKFNPDMIKFE